MSELLSSNAAFKAHFDRMHATMNSAGMMTNGSAGMMTNGTGGMHGSMMNVGPSPKP